MFLNYYKKLNPRKSEDRAIDFFINGNESVELKSDSYKMKDTGNFFIETCGNETTGAPGGPYRALKDNIHWFVYLFIQDKTFFWFKPAQMVRSVNQYVSQTGIVPKRIINKTWVGLGYLIPRDVISNICITIDKF